MRNIPDIFLTSNPSAYYVKLLCPFGSSKYNFIFLSCRITLVSPMDNNPSHSQQWCYQHSIMTVRSGRALSDAILILTKMNTDVISKIHLFVLNASQTQLFLAWMHTFLSLSLTVMPENFVLIKLIFILSKEREAPYARHHSRPYPENYAFFTSTRHYTKSVLHFFYY